MITLAGLALLAAMSIGQESTTQPAAVSAPITLWGDITFGMTREEVLALHPETIPDPDRPGRNKRLGRAYSSRIEIFNQELTSECVGRLSVQLTNGVASSVDLDGADGRCHHTDLLMAMTVSYGPPLSSRQWTENIGWGRNPLWQSYSEARWVSDGLEYTLLDWKITRKPATVMR